MGILHSVGQNGVNAISDVKTVQSLLNKSRIRFAIFSSACSALNVDGLCGPNTISSIGKFQKLLLQHHTPDHRVDPGRATWKKLNGNTNNHRNLLSTPAPTLQFGTNLELWFKNQIGHHLEGLYESFIGEIRDFNQNKRHHHITNPLRQGDDQWAKTLLGHSKRGTIHSYGCALLSLTMAAKLIGSSTENWPENTSPEDLDPIKANNILKKSNVFVANSYILYIVGGANALGMTGKDSGLNKKLASENRATIDQTLNDGGLVMAHVNYKGEWQGDHWVLLTNKTSEGEYIGADPAYGKAIKLFNKPDTGRTSENHVLLYGGSTSMGKSTPKNVQSYEVVRFITLKASQ